MLGLLERIGRRGEECRRRRRERKMRDTMLAPGKEIRVVLERGAQDSRPGRQGDGEQVRGLRRVADEDDIVGVVGADEAGHRAPRLLEQRRRVAALAATAAMKAAVPRDRRLHRVHGCDQRRRGRGEVEIDLVELLRIGPER